MLDLHRLIVVFILGLTEGLTEFLPVSSTGHMILINNLLNSTDYIDGVFIVVVQLGAIFSILLMFWRRLYRMGLMCVMNVFNIQHHGFGHFCIFHMLVGTLPGIILGTLCFKEIKLIFNPVFVIYGLIIGGIFLLIADRCSLLKTPIVLHIDNITYLQAFLIGCFQCLAFFPGFSRAGATIGGGLLVGLSRSVSLEFSFFLSIPIVCGATVLTLYHCKSYISILDSLFLFFGFIIAFCIAILTARVFLKIVQNISFIPFVIYRFLLAGGMYWVLII